MTESKRCPHCGANEEQGQPHDSGCPQGSDPTGEKTKASRKALSEVIANAKQLTQDADGVNRGGLDYRAGYVEGLGALLQRLNIEAVRGTAKQQPGLKAAHEAATALRGNMLNAMRNAGKAAEPRTPATDAAEDR